MQLGNYFHPSKTSEVSGKSFPSFTYRNNSLANFYIIRFKSLAVLVEINIFPANVAVSLESHSAT